MDRRLTFRLFDPGDLALYLDWTNQPEIQAVDNPGAFEAADAREIAAQWQKIVGWQRSWMICLDDRPIGYIGFVSDDQDLLTDEFFIVIGERDEWGKGHGREAMGWLVDKARSLGLSRLTGQVLGNNQRALAFYRKLGFRVVREQDPRFEREGRTWPTILIELPVD